MLSSLKLLIATWIVSSLYFTTGTYVLSPANGDMSQATVTANPTPNGAGDWRNKSRVLVVMTWTGSPVGTAQLYCSADNKNFVAYGAQAAISGAGPYAWDLVGTGCLWGSVVYTKTSGSGTLTVTESSNNPPPN